MRVTTSVCGSRATAATVEKSDGTDLAWLNNQNDWALAVWHSQPSRTSSRTGRCDWFLAQSATWAGEICSIGLCNQNWKRECSAKPLKRGALQSQGSVVVQLLSLVRVTTVARFLALLPYSDQHKV